MFCFKNICILKKINKKKRKTVVTLLLLMTHTYTGDQNVKPKTLI